MVGNVEEVDRKWGTRTEMVATGKAECAQCTSGMEDEAGLAKVQASAAVRRVVVLALNWR